MIRSLLLAASLAGLAGPALASACGDRIAALDRRLDDRTASAAGAGSGGQAVAAARQGQAANPGTANEPAMPFQGAAREAEATRRTAATGSPNLATARALLNEARVLDGRGDAAGCLARIADAEREAAPTR